MLAVVFATCVGPLGRPPAREERWLFLPTNLYVAHNVNAALHRIEQAAALDFTAVVLADVKLHFAKELHPRYREAVERIRAAASARNLEVIPALLPLGVGYGLLHHDPNLAAGLPVRRAPFRVTGMQAEPDREAFARLRNGSFERGRGMTPADWRVMDRHAVRRVASDATGGTHSLLLDGSAPLARIEQYLDLLPWQAYRLSLRLRTRNVGRPQAVRAVVQVGRTNLLFQRPALRGTQAWTQAHLVFNSMQGGAARILVGAWKAGGGKVWVDEVALEPAGLLNVLRRPDAEVRVHRADGERLVEGVDYEPIRDRMLDRIRQGRPLSTSHDPPPLRLRPSSRVRDGERLLVDFHHPIVFGLSRLTPSLCADGLERVAEKPLAWVSNVLEPRTVLLDVSEIRLIGHEEACARKGTAGDILRDAVVRLGHRVQARTGAERIAVWSDVFDPYHNAGDHYYLTKGGLQGSWRALPPEWIILNWNPTRPRESLRFFAERGHRQILALQVDAPGGAALGTVGVARRTRHYLGAAYVTFAGRYALEEFVRDLQGPH